MASPVRDNERHHRYELVLDNAVAFSTYRRQGAVTTLGHTEVPKSLGGRGIASTLIRGALDMERAAGRKVVPECPFVAHFMRKNPEYQDLLAPAGRALLEHTDLDARLDEALNESFPASDSPAVTPGHD